MLPKVSFTDDKKAENGSKMLSKSGKTTTFMYPLFRGADPIASHNSFLAGIERANPNNIDFEKIALEEQQLANMKRIKASSKSKTDLGSFVRQINMQKAEVFTSKATNPIAKIQFSGVPQETQRYQGMDKQSRL